MLLLAHIIQPSAILFKGIRTRAHFFGAFDLDTVSGVNIPRN
jgi:hypothetical protein